MPRSRWAYIVLDQHGQIREEPLAPFGIRVEESTQKWYVGKTGVSTVMKGLGEFLDPVSVREPTVVGVIDPTSLAHWHNYGLFCFHLGGHYARLPKPSSGNSMEE